MLKTKLAIECKNNILNNNVLWGFLKASRLYFYLFYTKNMFGKKILLLAAWYVAGNVVASVYSWGKKKAKKTQGKEDIKLMVENFISTQKNFVSDIEEKYVSEENREKLSEKKKQFLKHSEKYIKEWEKLLAEVSKNETVQAGKSKAEGFLWNIISKAKKLFSEIKSDEEKKSKKK
jgi:hypothetical protein